MGYRNKQRSEYLDVIQMVCRRMQQTTSSKSLKTLDLMDQPNLEKACRNLFNGIVC